MSSPQEASMSVILLCMVVCSPGIMVENRILDFCVFDLGERPAAQHVLLGLIWAESRETRP